MWFSKKPKISFCTIVKNESRFLGRMLESVSPYVDEIIVLDNGSKDNSSEIAKNFGAFVIHSNGEGDLSALRNETIELAKGEWIFYLDGDEVIEKKDMKQVLRLAKSQKFDAFSFTSRIYTNTFDVFHEWKPCKGEYPEAEKIAGTKGFVDIKWGVRLFRNKPEYEFEGFIHEMVNGTVPKEKISECNVMIQHFKELVFKNCIFLNDGNLS